MIDTIERLLALQDRDQRIRSLRSELLQVPEERKARVKQLADCAARLDAAKTRLKEIEIEKKNLEIEAGTKRSAIDRYKNQQLQTRKNEEFTALSHEIAANEKAISQIEDREIVFMEEAEALAPRIQAAEAEFASEKARIDKAISLLDAKIPNVEALISDLEKARKESAEGLDEDLLDQYDRIFRSKGDTAVVPLENDVCTGCHMKVTHQTTLEVRGEKAIVHCPNCGRILYLPN
ncbi:MAG: C4-type zinc ribbon domain-containing protein [Terrimicrobiaceae bacterium]